MKFSSNLPEIKEIEYADYVMIANKYLCRYVITLSTGTKFYFTNVTRKEDIYEMEFTTVATIRDEDIYVFAPDTLESERDSVLVVLWFHQNEYPIDIKQNALFEFYHRNDEKNQIVAMMRFAPEWYPMQSEHLHTYLTVKFIADWDYEGRYSLNKFEVTHFLRTSTIDNQLALMLVTRQKLIHSVSDAQMKQIKESANTFAMHAQRTMVKVPVAIHESCEHWVHPATKYVIDKNNVIVVNTSINRNQIIQFLNNDQIPPEASIIWYPEEEAIESFKKFRFDQSPQSFGVVDIVRYGRANLKYIFIGFSLETTSALRLIASN